MASAISHVYAAQKYRKLFLKQQDINLHHFYLGTLFPDIRYLGTISRTESHKGAITHESVLSATDDFERGRLLHCLVDLRREALVQQLGIPELVPDNPMVPSVLKFIEDILNYPLATDLPLVIDFMAKSPLDQELSYVSLDVACRWHSVLGEFISQSPTLESVLKFVSTLTLTPEQIALAGRLYETLVTNPELKLCLVKVYDQIFDDLS